MLARLKRSLGAGRGRRQTADPFSPAFLSPLDRFRFRTGSVSTGRPGETVVRGMVSPSGSEIQGFQPYVPGDDIRYVDWIALGRLDQLLTKRFVAEREISVHLLVDGSASMGAPEADEKFHFARAFAVGLAYVAVRHHDSVRIALLQERPDGALLESPVYRHRRRFLELRPFVEALSPAGPTVLRNQVATYLPRHDQGGLAFLVSDFLVDRREYEESLRLLRAAGFDVHAVQIAGPLERSAQGLGGRVQVHDVETGRTRRVFLGERDRRRYREGWERRTGEIREFCHRHGIAHVVAPTEMRMEQLLARSLAVQGVLRAA